MPISYEIDDNTRSVRTTGSGVVTEKQLLVYLRNLLSDESVPLPIRDLHDLSTVTDFQVSASTIHLIVELSSSAPERIQGGKVAIIASEDLVFGMSRMFQMLSEHAPMVETLRQSGLAPAVQVFRDAESARRWLLEEAPVGGPR